MIQKDDLHIENNFSYEIGHIKISNDFKFTKSNALKLEDPNDEIDKEIFDTAYIDFLED